MMPIDAEARWRGTCLATGQTLISRPRQNNVQPPKKGSIICEAFGTVSSVPSWSSVVISVVTRRLRIYNQGRSPTGQVFALTERRSVGMLVMSSHLTKAWSKASEGLRLVSLASAWSISMGLALEHDASTTKGILEPRGWERCGKSRSKLFGHSPCSDLGEQNYGRFVGTDYTANL